jgi:hypothetical protein
VECKGRFAHDRCKRNIKIQVEEVGWDRSGIELAGKYTFFYGKGNQIYELGTGLSLQKGII